MAGTTVTDIGKTVDHIRTLLGLPVNIGIKFQENVLLVCNDFVVCEIQCSVELIT